jgi:hypothetical protein
VQAVLALRAEARAAQDNRLYRNKVTVPFSIDVLGKKSSQVTVTFLLWLAMKFTLQGWCFSCMLVQEIRVVFGGDVPWDTRVSCASCVDTASDRDGTRRDQFEAQGRESLVGNRYPSAEYCYAAH